MTPIWYSVHQKKLSYTQFLDRFRSPLFNEAETIQLFIYICLEKHDPYIDNVHVIHRLMTSGMLGEREVRCLYLYRLFRPDCDQEVIIQGADQKLGLQVIILPPRFEEELMATLRLVFEGLLNWSVILNLKFPEYIPGDTETLRDLLQFKEEFENHFKLSVITVTSLCRVYHIHQTFLSLKQFLEGKNIPGLFTLLRTDHLFFKSVIESYSVVQLQACMPLTDFELEMVYSAQDRLCKQGDLEFFIYYCEQMRKTFGEDKVNQKIIQYMLPSNKNDRYAADKALRELSPERRSRHFLQRAPVSDLQLERFLKSIEEEGVNDVLNRQVTKNKKCLCNMIEETGSRLVMETTLTAQSIYRYNPEELIWHFEEGDLYLFTYEELKHCNRINPYNRNRFPDYYFENGVNKKSEAIEEIWSEILRRKIELLD